MPNKEIFAIHVTLVFIIKMQIYLMRITSTKQQQQISGSSSVWRTTSTSRWFWYIRWEYWKNAASSSLTFFIVSFACQPNAFFAHWILKLTEQKLDKFDKDWLEFSLNNRCSLVAPQSMINQNKMKTISKQSIEQKNRLSTVGNIHK